MLKIIFLLFIIIELFFFSFAYQEKEDRKFFERYSWGQIVDNSLFSGSFVI